MSHLLLFAAFMISRVFRRAVPRRPLRLSRPSSAASTQAPSPLACSTHRSHPRSNLRSPLPRLTAFLPCSVSYMLCIRSWRAVSDVEVTGHDFVPRHIGGTTYFPIRLDEARLGYITPSGVEVFMNH